MIRPLAQNNLQLYIQMREHGFSKEDIKTIQRDYETAIFLFGAKMRSTGRAFLCHAIGTASAALLESASLLDIRAALLHAAYRHGRFADGKKGNTKRHQKWIVDRCGSELEALLTRFPAFPFNSKVVPDYIKPAQKLDEDTLRLVRLKLANDVDDSHDFGANLAHKTRYKTDKWLTMCRDLSRALEFKYFAAQFQQSIDRLDDCDWLDTATQFDLEPNTRWVPNQLIRRNLKRK